MTIVRDYIEAQDAPAVGRLIADTFSEYNLAFASAEELPLYLGPFRNADSSDSGHANAIAEVIQATMVLVAEDEGEIVGVLRGRSDRLQSLFVRGDHHRHGIGRQLVERFERECIRQGAHTVTVAATLFAVPFYTKLGYKKTTGVRSGWCFEGPGLPYQPMKKILSKVP